MNKNQAVRNEDIETARSLMRQYLDTDLKLYTITRHVSRSGKRSVSLLAIVQRSAGASVHATVPEIRDASPYVARILGMKFDRAHGGVITETGWNESEIIRELGFTLYRDAEALRHISL